MFLSGGTALRDLAESLTRLTHRSIHILTPFDSGGSSAAIRAAFDMLSVGDVRNRLLALADPEAPGHGAALRLLDARIESLTEGEDGKPLIQSLIDGSHPWAAACSAPLRALMATHLAAFQQHAPGFDLRQASIGNLLLAGGYLKAGRDLDVVLEQYAEALQVRGTVVPVVDANLHLAALLRDGTRIVGQHLLTGKQAQPVRSPIESLELVLTLDHPAPARVTLSPSTRDLFDHADLIVFPMGSFYTSVVANLLPRGVGQAIADARCPKVYVPNVGCDPEMLGMTVDDGVDALLRALRHDAGHRPTTELLDTVLIDGSHESSHAVDAPRFRAGGGRVLDRPIVHATDEGLRHDAETLAEQLVALAAVSRAP